MTKPKPSIRRVSPLSLGRQIVRQLGWRSAAEYILRERLLRLVTPSGDSSGYRTYQLSVPDNRIPLICRLRSSDRYAFGQVFIHQQYACPKPFRSPKYIVDCGANVGYTSVYFLQRFPEAKVVAIEPDRRNYEVLVKNLAPYGSRAVPMLAAVWSHQGGMILQPSFAGRGSEWSSQVREAGPGETFDVEAVDIAWLLDHSPDGYIDILKIDIEGAEEEVFAQGYERWLDRTGMILIELHGERSRELFFEATSRANFQVSQRGEITIAQSIAKSPSSKINTDSERLA